MKTKEKIFLTKGGIIGIMTMKFNDRLKTCNAVMEFNIQKRYEKNHQHSITQLMVSASEYCSEFAIEYAVTLNPVYKFQKAPINMSSSAIEACFTETSSLVELSKLIEMVEAANQTATKETHYTRLSEWANPLNEYVHINHKGVDSKFWLKIYQVLNSIIYSPNLKSQVASHHSSAFERNQALLTELTFIYNYKKNR